MILVTFKKHYHEKGRDYLFLIEASTESNRQAEGTTTLVSEPEITLKNSQMANSTSKCIVTNETPPNNWLPVTSTTVTM